ncbi:hypothetical protein CYMTET_35516, partial [Cymbomonas tetramitiformis]
SFGRRGRAGMRSGSHLKYRPHQPGPPDLIIAVLVEIPKFVAWAYPVLVTYAGMFFVIPLARAALAHLWVNPRIKARNAQRRQRVAVLLKEAVEQYNEKGKQAREYQGCLQLAVAYGNVLYPSALIGAAFLTGFQTALWNFSHKLPPASRVNH